MHRRGRRVAVAAFAVMVCVASGQPPVASLPEFEVISVRPMEDVPRLPVRISNDNERMRGFTLMRFLLTNAFNVSTFRLEAPEWTKWAYFQIDAIAPKGVPKEVRLQMLGPVLVERFGLKYHFEDRQTNVYILGPGSGPLKLAQVHDLVPSPIYNPNEFKQRSATMANLTFWLSNELQREVIDETHLDGSYAFNLDWSGMRDGDGTADSGLVNKALKSVGLKIESRKQPMKYLIVDRLNRTPTPN